MSSWGCRTVATKIGVPKVDEAMVSCTGVMGAGAFVVSVLSTKAPAACLPKGALLDPMTRCILIAPETVREGDLVPPTPLAKYSAAFQTVFSFFDIRWTLGSKNAWNPIITGGNKESGGGRGMCGKEVLLETGADCTGGKVSFYYE